MTWPRGAHRDAYIKSNTPWRQSNRSALGHTHTSFIGVLVSLQGSATVGLKSKTHVVLVALKRSTSELSAYQNKIFPVDDHVGVSIAGLTADGRLLCKFMRTECLNSRYVFNTPFPISRLVSAVGNSIHSNGCHGDPSSRQPPFCVLVVCL